MTDWSSYFLFYYRYFANSFLSCYTYAVILLLALAVIKNKFSHEAKNWLYVLNTLMGYVSLLGLFYWILELIVAWYDQNSYDVYTFIQGGYGLTNNPVLLYTFLLLPSFLGLFFLSKKIRLRIWFVIVFLIVFNAGAVWIWLLKFNRDYLPSSWSVIYDESFWEKLSKWVLLPVVLISTYWILNKRKKLPHPSLFFKNDAQPL